jgi:hypothetical protein
MPIPALLEDENLPNHPFNRWVKEKSISNRMNEFRFFTEGNEVNEGASRSGV